MKILVPIKSVPDPAKRARVTPDGQLDLRGNHWVVDPPDEAALEAALHLRENGGNAIQIVAVSVGRPACEDQLRAALAMGADRALLVLDDLPLDAGIVSYLLAAIARRENPSLIIMGTGSTDNNSGQIPQRVAALLNWPQLTHVTQLELTPTLAEARAVRTTDGRLETWELPLPGVMTADQDSYLPRYIPLRAIIEARAKPLDRIASSEFGREATSRITVMKNEKPPPRAACRMAGSMDELVNALRGEARAI